MALVNKVGSLIRQTARKHINHELSASNSSIFQIIRCMSSSKLLVEGLSHATTKTSLKKAFVPYGDVKEAQVYLKSEKASKNAGSSGFGLVVYSNTESASAAIKALDQKELHGRLVGVKYLENKAQEDRGSGVGYGSSFLEGYTWGILDQIASSKKIQDSDAAGPNDGGSDKRNCGDKGGGESHNSGITSGHRNANEDYGNPRSGYFDGESHNSDSARGNRNAGEDYGDHSSGYFDGEIQTSDPAGGNNNNFFRGWGGDSAGGSNDRFFSGWGDGDNAKGVFSDFFNDD